MKWQLLIGALVASIALPCGMADAQGLKPEQIMEASLPDKPNPRALAAKVQIMLDRARFSPGVIDGRMGENVEFALAAFRKAHQLDGQKKPLDEATLRKLAEASHEASEPILIEYKMTEEDVRGPFTKKIPDSLEDQGTLERLGYTGPSELLAERFHMDEDFLKELNPGKDFAKAGTAIMVANVKNADPAERASAKRIDVDKSSKQLRVYGEGDKLLAVYPATIGSTARPAPTGELKVKGVAKNPIYTYNPEYKFEGVKTDKPFTIAPGPNNPVGSVWIDLSKDGYGIHGTPDPDVIGKSASHGCVRLTNWDAEHLAEMVRPGVVVNFLGS